LSSKGVMAVIPARYGSTRFPGKPLAMIGGVPMIIRVLRSAGKIRGVDRIVVATDDERIKSVVEGSGGAAEMTSPGHTSGTSRVAEVASRYRYPVVLNIQGDEPILPVGGIGNLVETIRNERKVVMATLAKSSQDTDALARRDVVKVVRGLDGYALYFSRSAVPSGGGRFLQHIGVYAYRRSFLLRYESLRRGPLEKSERLEQLRALENGYRIRVLLCRGNSLGVDSPEDIKRVEKRLERG